MMPDEWQRLCYGLNPYAVSLAISPCVEQKMRVDRRVTCKLFRSGALEAFQIIAPAGVDRPGFALPWVQQAVTELLPRWLGGLTALEVTGPYQFGVTLANVRGMRPMRDDAELSYWGDAAREATLLLPAWTIDPAKFDPARLFEELRVLLHQAFGRDGVRTQYF
jgi:hypothetical protein